MLISLGAGLLNAPLTVTVTSGVAPGEAGAASGLMSTAKQIGGALGLAALVALTAEPTGVGGGPVTPAWRPEPGFTVRRRTFWRPGTGGRSPFWPWCWLPSPSWRPRCRDGVTAHPTPLASRRTSSPPADRAFPPASSARTHGALSGELPVMSVGCCCGCAP
ncbi:hypothetical protein HD597_004138 [Nonomuraea thailandensis]|uniref:Uncharacterized protein n=1 Tax=Nonomuraea thailandensis TaxID=1188745 RepID=A0A9X2GMP8_9ACTN|nr:hypothetical protein [Nonomuraea thailandensis]MCP2357118.1 hypothetical protein [Nonomuraea thailandensis]